jgi:hypothetical protein
VLTGSMDEAYERGLHVFDRRRSEAYSRLINSRSCQLTILSSVRCKNSRILAHPVVVDVLWRHPAVPGGGGRVGELLRQLERVAPVIPDGGR